MVGNTLVVVIGFLEECYGLPYTNMLVPSQIGTVPHNIIVTVVK